MGFVAIFAEQNELWYSNGCFGFFLFLNVFPFFFCFFGSQGGLFLTCIYQGTCELDEFSQKILFFFVKKKTKKVAFNEII